MRDPLSGRRDTEAEITLVVADEADLVLCGSTAREFARHLGFEARAQWEVAIAVSELVANILKYAREGQVRLRRLPDPDAGLEMQVVDHGPGLDATQAVRAAAVAEASRNGRDPPPRQHGLGVGLEAVARLMDEVRIQTAAGTGTTVVARKRLPGGSADP